MGAYTAAKFAMVGMSEVLREELAPHNVGVTVFCPGLMRTRLEQTTLALGNESITGVPLGAAMEPFEAAQCAVNAVPENSLYALSHPEYWPHVHKRMEALSSAFEAAEKEG